MNKWLLIKDSLINLCSFSTELIYIVEPANWSTRWDGKYITQSLNNLNLIKSKVSTSAYLLHNKILHFGSVGTFIKENGIRKSITNKKVLTWFHIPDNDKRLKYIPSLNEKVDYVHTSCHITKNKLIQYGLKEDKIVIVPIGIDLKNFFPYSEIKKYDLKLKYGIPKNKIVIGSFQKDGAGWGKGNEAKYVKGPDIFCSVIEKLAKKYNIHVLLTGPARGYVKSRLNQSHISYSHHYIKDFLKIVDFYNLIDLYIVTSREEGGPKAITESMATGVPVISTKVGMAPEIIISGENGYLCEIDDVDDIYEKSSMIIEDTEIKTKMIKNGIISVKNYEWETVSRKLFYEIYSRMF